MTSIYELVKRYKSASKMTINELNIGTPQVVKRFDMDRSFQRSFSRVPKQIERRAKELSAIYSNTAENTNSTIIVAVTSMVLSKINVQAGDLIVVKGVILSHIKITGQGSFTLEPHSGNTAKIELTGLFSDSAKQPNIVTALVSNQYSIEARFKVTGAGEFGINLMYCVDSGNFIYFDSGRLDMFILQQD